MTGHLEARIEELRRAIETKELERQELLLKQKDLQTGLQAAAEAAQAKCTVTQVRLRKICPMYRYPGKGAIANMSCNRTDRMVTFIAPLIEAV